MELTEFEMKLGRIWRDSESKKPRWLLQTFFAPSLMSFLFFYALHYKLEASKNMSLTAGITFFLILLLVMIAIQVEAIRHNKQHYQYIYTRLSKIIEDRSKYRGDGEIPPDEELLKRKRDLYLFLDNVEARRTGTGLSDLSDDQLAPSKSLR